MITKFSIYKSNFYFTMAQYMKIIYSIFIILTVHIDIVQLYLYENSGIMEF
jgi:hypothetical protein